MAVMVHEALRWSGRGEKYEPEEEGATKRARGRKRMELAGVEEDGRGLKRVEEETLEERRGR